MPWWESTSLLLICLKINVSHSVCVACFNKLKTHKVQPKLLQWLCNLTTIDNKVAVIFPWISRQSQHCFIQHVVRLIYFCSFTLRVFFFLFTQSPVKRSHWQWWNGHLEVGDSPDSQRCVNKLLRQPLAAGKNPAMWSLPLEIQFLWNMYIQGLTGGVLGSLIQAKLLIWKSTERCYLAPVIGLSASHKAAVDVVPLAPLPEVKTSTVQPKQLSHTTAETRKAFWITWVNFSFANKIW